MKGIKIWNKEVDKKDSYVDFKGNFTCKNQGKVSLRISCDSIFTIFLNGENVGFGSCSNYPDRKLYYTFDLTKKVKEENELLVTVWHQGVDTMTYFPQDAFLLFEVVQNGEILLASGKDVDCRINNNYKQGYCKAITSQIGFSFYYDVTAKDLPYEKATEYGFDKAVSTGIKPLKLLKRRKISVKERENGYLIDLKKELVGFLDLDITSEKEQVISVSYGEHLVKGKVPEIIGDRRFSVEIKLGKGKNEYLNTFRRIAGRYLEINGKDFQINYLGIRPVEYPLQTVKKKFDDKLIKKIYDVSVYTLKCCMHEHYEDCPWREQALYTMDSRNQMLCGHYAFKGHEFQKASLLLIANSLRKDGLLSICAPTAKEIPIPFFSLIYPMQVYEYVRYSGDKDILNKVGKTVKRIMSAFDEKVDENGLIESLPYPYWNFYEWNKESDGGDELMNREKAKFVKKYDLILNAMYVYATSFTDKLFGTKTDMTKTKQAIKDAFFNAKTGLYDLSTNCRKPSILGNSLAILIGLGDKDLAEKLKEGKGLVPITLSMNTFFYDALLKVDESNGKWIIENIKEKYSFMLKKHATTFWETERGWKDFNNAGSLCHGWSAMPVYYFNRLSEYVQK
ncbi:MAG: hypothetical protein MJ072_01255 [Clostridia bacterium]|nr:hypothetical protein [Clostridia bacterium]